MTKMFRGIAIALLAAALAACGGGGGSAGATGSGSGSGPGTGTGTGSTPTLAVASFIYSLSQPSLKNSGTDSTDLTVTALDASNNPMSGATVAVAVDSGVYTPKSSVTDASGQASGSITIGANKANRDITATITLNGMTSKAVIAVTGSAVSLTPVPATPAPGAQVRVDLKVTDSNGNGIANAPVALTGTLGFSTTVTTDQAGNASATLGAAPSAAGTYSIDAAALGVQSTRSVQVVSGSGSGIPVVTDTITSASLSIVPNTIAPNATGSTANRAGLKAKFLNGSNQAVQNVRVRFEIVPPALGSGEQLSTAAATVYSDVNGEAISDYIAGSRSSPTNGVVIRACYGPDDAAIASGACPNVVTQTLTVASQPLSITLGDNNLLQRGNNSLTYIKQFDIAVADSAGNAVSNAVVSASVDITHFGKGGNAVTTTSTTTAMTPYQVTGIRPPTIADLYIQTTPTGDLDAMAMPTAGARVWCVNEDINRNGALDTSNGALGGTEDINGNGKLDPRKADVILSFVGSNVTGSNGRLTIQVEYPQNVATWLAYTVKVTTNVAGSEGTDAKSYISSFIEGDEKNGSFLTPPYGSQRCVDTN